MITRSVVLVLCIVFLAGDVLAGGDKKTPSLQSRLKVKKVSETGSLLQVEMTFTNKTDKEQKFDNGEYRMTILDKNGEQVGDGPLSPTAEVRTIVLKGRSTSDKNDVLLPTQKLKAGEEYLLVVSVRNLTGYVKFKAK